ATTCLAQTAGGRISGRLVDPSGGGIAFAQVEAEQVETGLSRATQSDEAGEYVFPALPVGNYRILAAQAGLRATERLIKLEVGRGFGADLHLPFEGVRRGVVVGADTTPLVEPATAALGTVIGRATVSDLPLNDRQFLQLALLAAGAHPAAPGSELSRQNNSGLHLNGAREASNNFLLDGVDNNDLFINRLSVSPPLDSVREFRLHASSYQAEFGRSGGAQVNVLSQAGGNRFHGTIYEYLRNKVFDARNFFDAPERPVPQFQRNQFGGA